MRLPLILGATPTLFDNNLPKVPVRAGTYQIEVTGQDGSKMEIRTDDHNAYEVIPGNRIILGKDTTCHIHFDAVGKEQLISVYLKRVT